MNRDSFERVIRSCCRHLGVDDVVVIGSQALYGSYPDIPEAAAVSMEVDVLLRDEAARDDIAGLFGELSQFHETFGVYADPVDVTTGHFPAGWTERLVDSEIADGDRTYRARCVEPHDLCVAKLVAGRDKDRALVTALIAAGRVDPAALSRRLGETDLDSNGRQATERRLEAWTRH